MIAIERQLEIAPLGDHAAIFDGLGHIRPQRLHLLGAAQVLLRAVGFRPARIGQGTAGVYAKTGLVGLIILRVHKTHVIGRDHGRVAGSREIQGAVDVFRLARTPGALQLQVVTIREVV